MKTEFSRQKRNVEVNIKAKGEYFKNTVKLKFCAVPEYMANGPNDIKSSPQSHCICLVTDDCEMFTKHLMSSTELSGVVKDQKRKPTEREVDKDLTPAGKRYVVTASESDSFYGEYDAYTTGRRGINSGNCIECNGSLLFQTNF